MSHPVNDIKQFKQPRRSLLCISCKEEREVSLGRFYNAKKQGGNCWRCAMELLKKRRVIECPVCHKSRQVNPTTFWAMKAKKTGGRCFQCGMVSQRGKRPSIQRISKMKETKAKKRAEMLTSFSCLFCQKVVSTIPCFAQKKFCSNQCWGKYNRGEKNIHWTGGFKLRGKHTLFDPQYVDWRTSVFQRDNWKCRIVDKNCNGKLEAHHILNWKEYPELRYQINNGITLCHAHHPRGRAKEKRLSPYFQELVSVSKE